METSLKTLFDADRPNRDRDKALLIGIAYSSKDGSQLNDGVKPLIRAHRDVKDFGNHLIRESRQSYCPYRLLISCVCLM